MKIQIRRGLAEDWRLSNPILAEGEFAVELDTKKIKQGDGLTRWNALPYHGSTKLSLGIENINNTSDIDKPISTAVQTYITATGEVLSYKADISSLTQVAFSGDYNDLINLPQFAGADWNFFSI
jgi:hypothetical protein